MQNLRPKEVLDYEKYLDEHKQMIENLKLEVFDKDKEIRRLQKELDEVAERAREEKQELETEWQTRMQTKLSEREGELKEEWSMKMKSVVLNLQQELERHEDDRQNNQNALNQLDDPWTHTLFSALANTFTGEDIPADLVQLLASKTSSSIDKFAFQPTSGYVFAEIYTGCQHISQLVNDELRWVDFLYRMKRFVMPSMTQTGANT